MGQYISTKLIVLTNKLKHIARYYTAFVLIGFPSYYGSVDELKI